MYFQHRLIITVIITQSPAAFHSISWIESDLKLECCKNTNQLMGKKKKKAYKPIWYCSEIKEVNEKIKIQNPKNVNDCLDKRKKEEGLIAVWIW